MNWFTDKIINVVMDKLFSIGAPSSPKVTHKIFSTEKTSEFCPLF